ncbi:MAG: nucleoside-diphosphate-sugar pyrophosphorylase [Chthoniobacterales bacterium]|nr:MAG: nucleoside-diphosphate-sugar pyrophosphorylase [Chthoniobacterales bacterium]
MNVLILAAGYATRLYPLTLNKAKPLLQVAGKPMIAWVVDNLRGVDAIETIYIVTNSKFCADFEAWTKQYAASHHRFNFKIINDGSRTDDDKLGAIGDINLVLTREQIGDTDLLIIAGDNLFSEPLTDFVNQARGSEAAVAVYDVGDLEQIKKYNNMEVDKEGVIVHFEEKPKEPINTLTAIALYYYSPAVLSLFTTYIAAGNNPDQPGRFIQWLYPRKPVKTVKISGTWFDVGSKETLEEANRIFAQFT